MSAFYNEFEPFAAAWLKELIKAGAIEDGEVCEKDMWDVVPSELAGFERVHFCAGIGGWAEALRLAGWSDDQPVWTVSLPCQPFSSAGRGAGFADARGQLAEAFFWLAGVCRPGIIFGEQVEAAIRHDWLDVMASQLESIGYTVGAVGFPASSVGAFHIRQRLYWVAYTDGNTSSGVAAAEHSERWGEHQEHKNAHGRYGPGRSSKNDRDLSGLLRLPESGAGNRSRVGKPILPDTQLHSNPIASGVVLHEITNFWSDAEWIPCRDGKARPTQPGLFPLAHGVQNRVGTLRGAGNAIVPQAAAEFIKSVMEVLGEG